MLFVDGKLTTLTVIVEIIEKVNNTYRTATSEIKRETCIRFLKTIQLYTRYHENMKLIVKEKHCYFNKQ